MRSTAVAAILVILIVGASVWFIFGPRLEPDDGAKATALVGVTLIDGTGRPPVPDAVVLIRGSRIAAAGPRADVRIPAGTIALDFKGKYVIPGLADMHNHLRSGTSAAWQPPADNLKFLVPWGITATFVPALHGSAVEETRKAAEGDSTLLAHFYTTGPILSPNVPADSAPGGDYGPKTPDAARAAVRDLSARGVDAVKIFHDDMGWLMKQHLPLLSTDVIAAAIDEAHKKGLKVYAHAPQLDRAKEFLKAGGDGLLHGIISDPVDDEFIALMKQNKAVYVSTLTLFEVGANADSAIQREREYDLFGVLPDKEWDRLLDPGSDMREHLAKRDNAAYTKEHLPVLRDNLRRVYAAGIPIVGGTDTGLLGVVIGISSHLELLLHVEAGLPPSAVLQAATVNAARMVGRERDWGSVEPGKLADIVILDADPLADISNTRRIHRVIKGGEIIEPFETWRSLGGLKRTPAQGG